MTAPADTIRQAVANATAYLTAASADDDLDDAEVIDTAWGERPPGRCQPFPRHDLTVGDVRALRDAARTILGTDPAAPTKEAQP